MSDDWDEDDPEPGGVFEPEAGMAVWVQADRCDTCIFHPGNRMHLMPGRLADMVRTVVQQGTHIPCHDTLLYAGPTRQRPAVCRGMFDHPKAGPASQVLALGRSLGTIRYQVPNAKEPDVLLSERIASTGITMTCTPGEVRTHSTGWRARTWEVVYHLDGRTFPTTFHMGNPDEEPTLAECLDITLNVARRVKGADTYEEWAQEFAGADRRQWQPRDVYLEQVDHTERLETFLGEEFAAWLEETEPAHAEEAETEEHAETGGMRHGDGQVDHRYTVGLEHCGYEQPRHVARFCGQWLGSAEHADQAWALAWAHRARGQAPDQDGRGVAWEVQEVEPDARAGLSVWQVWAVIQGARLLAGKVIERVDHYQACADDGLWYGKPRPFREQAIEDIKARLEAGTARLEANEPPF